MPIGVSLQAYVQSLKSVALCVRTQSWLLWTVKISCWPNVSKEHRVSDHNNFVLQTNVPSMRGVLKPISILSNCFWDIENSLTVSFGFYFVNLRAIRFQVYIFQSNTTALDYLYLFVSYCVDKFCRRTDGLTNRQTNGYWLHRFAFTSWSRIYILVNT